MNKKPQAMNPGVSADRSPKKDKSTRDFADPENVIENGKMLDEAMRAKKKPLPKR